MTTGIMFCLDRDGKTIEVRKVPRCTRFTMQAASDHRSAEKARQELGDKLHCCDFHYVKLFFDARGRSFAPPLN